MAESRRNLMFRVAEIVGDEVVRVVEADQGWPGIVNIRSLNGEWIRCALHIGPVGSSHRKRDTVERRFQNPGQRKPVYGPSETLPLLLGLSEENDTPVLVGMDTQGRHEGNTRQSYFSPVWLLEEAARRGWAQHISTTDEMIVAFHPSFLPAYVEMRRKKLRLPGEQIATIAEASGLVGAASETSAERARRIASRLFRDHAFGRAVVEAYGGLCAMCGLNLGLIEGAHICPVSSPDSHDEICNGIALCGNHHSAFDRHQIWIDPFSGSVKFNPRTLNLSVAGGASSDFITNTFKQIRYPENSDLKPHPTMFQKRYEFYGDSYQWALSASG